MAKEDTDATEQGIEWNPVFNDGLFNSYDNLSRRGNEDPL